MGTLSFPYDFTAGTEVRSDQMNSNFTAAETWSTTLADDNFSSAAGMYSAYRTLFTSQGFIAGGLGAGTYMLVNAATGFTPLRASGLSLLLTADETTIEAPNFKYLDDADFAISGRTTKLRVRAQVSTNGTIPAITFTFGLHPVTWSGAADTLTASLGAAVTNTTVAIASPGINATTTGVSSDVSVPADGLYALGVVTSGALTANAAGYLSAELQQRWS